ncbi:hypothetical protein G6F68_020555 [Rhizopus microsporus]|nr:hypothetical protein G6F68_020555 [Rhizopus microsporus]
MALDDHATQAQQRGAVIAPVVDAIAQTVEHRLGDGAGQQHEQGQDDGEDRPRDEEGRELHWRASEAAACCMGTTRGVTAMPGRTRPLMTIRSPPCKPVLMTRSPSSIWPSSTARYWARLSLPPPRT